MLSAPGRSWGSDVIFRIVHLQGNGGDFPSPQALPGSGEIAWQSSPCLEKRECFWNDYSGGFKRDSWTYPWLRSKGHIVIHMTQYKTLDSPHSAAVCLIVLFVLGFSRKLKQACCPSSQGNEGHFLGPWLPCLLNLHRCWVLLCHSVPRVSHRLWRWSFW